MTASKASRVHVAKGRSFGLPVIYYHGTREALIAAGVATEKMLHLEEIDNS